MTCIEFRELALSLPHTVAAKHFDRTAFKVLNKRIFATLHEESETANIKFSSADQSVYCLINKETIYPVNNKWGLQGWTTFQIVHVDHQLMLDALHTAYQDVLKIRKK